MLTEDDIRKVLATKSETANVDYREGFPWTNANLDKKYELVKDLMAMANTKDGGRVIVGVRNKTFELVGVAHDVYETFDANNVVQMAHDNAEPKIVCHVSKHVIDDKRLIVLDVEEFDDTPIICTNTIKSSETKPRMILREAAVYVRTSAATTEEITSPVEMRSLLGRALAKKKESLLQDIQNLLSGRAPAREVEGKSRYEEELLAAEQFVANALKAI